VKETNWSSNVLKYEEKKSELNSFGFEDFEADSPEAFTIGGEEVTLPKKVREEIDRRLREIEQREALAEKMGYERGFTQGEKDGREIGKQSMEIIAQQLSEVVDAIGKIPQEIAAKYSNLIQEIIIGVAENVLMVEVEKNSEIVKKSIEMAFQALDDAHKVTIKLNPKDYALLDEFVLESMQEIKTGSKVTWKPDPEIKKGGCIVETDTQLVDATLDSRMEQIREAFKEL